MPTSGDVGPQRVAGEDSTASVDARTLLSLELYERELAFNPPLLKAYGAKLILDAKADISSAEPGAVLAAVAVAAEYGLPLPSWLADRFLAAYRDVLCARAASWDEVFGRPHAKGRQLDSDRWRMYIGPRIGQAVFEAIINGRSIGKDLFDEIAPDFDMGATACEDAFRFAIERRLIPPVAEIRRQAAAWPAERERLIAARRADTAGRHEEQWEPGLPMLLSRAW
jgi:hypothetical protein